MNPPLQQISQFTKTGDIAIINIDANQDKESLQKAYDNDFLYNLVFGIISHFTKICPSFLPHQNSFEVKCLWDESNKLMDIFFVVNSRI